MIPKSTLRSFLSIAGSSLLAISTASAETYYWDSNDGASGFGSTAVTWAAPAPGTLTSGWSTDSTGTTAINGNSVTTSVAGNAFAGVSTLAITSSGGTPAI